MTDNYGNTDSAAAIVDVEGYLDSTINETACDFYISPSGKTWTSTGTFMDTIPSIEGCDSVITVNLTINNSNAGSEPVTACDEYTWDANGQTYSSSGTYNALLTNTDGCDSAATLNLTIKNSTSRSITKFVCDSLISPSGKYVWKSVAGFT
ncbi:MAG: hypothetical protein U5L96_16680 [Owenweeksia sp.]|nr:hypothetical protein [Owenweeksia sp.]